MYAHLEYCGSTKSGYIYSLNGGFFRVNVVQTPKDRTIGWCSIMTSYCKDLVMIVFVAHPKKRVMPGIMS